MKNNDIAIVIFSKNRPLQLDLTLASLHYCCEDVELADTYIIYKTDKEYETAYGKVFRENVGEFIPETVFQGNLLSVLNLPQYEYVMFVVDDTIFVDNFKLHRVTSFLDMVHDAIGFSLRLGENTKYCYPLDATQSLPPMTNLSHNVRAYDWANKDWDFSYPMELSSSVYRKNDILNMISDRSFRNPNELESLLAVDVMYTYYKQFPTLLCFGTSVAFSNPVNKVQTVNNNRVDTLSGHSPEELLQKYNDGLRIHPKKFFHHVPSACHEVISLF